MTENAAHASRTANTIEPRKHKLGFIIATVGAIFMTVTGALGTGEAPFLTRLAFWLIAMESGALIGMGVTTGIIAWGRLRGHPIIEAPLVAFCIALPLTLIVIAARSIFFELAMPSTIGMAIMFGYVLFVSLIITALDYVMIGRAAQAPAPTIAAPVPIAEEPKASRFRDRLPPHLRDAPILALQSEDHYLRVHCAGGDALILMRLADAIAELADADGAQTHRSWWVAKPAIAQITPGDGRATLTLANGITAPISRTNYQALKKAGWLR